jgi:hypothetical protein
MSKYKQFFTEHSLLKERIIEICRLFHKYDPNLYPDILEEDLLFIYDEKNTITVINSELVNTEDYCYIDIKWLDATNDEIVAKILGDKVKREDYITFRSNKK